VENVPIGIAVVRGPRHRFEYLPRRGGESASPGSAHLCPRRLLSDAAGTVGSAYLLAARPG
jgi:hypothetical protein